MGPVYSEDNDFLSMEDDGGGGYFNGGVLVGK